MIGCRSLRELCRLMFRPQHTLGLNAIARYASLGFPELGMRLASLPLNCSETEHEGHMTTNRQEAIEKIRELTHGIDFCMLTTMDGDYLRSRPMSTQEFEFDGNLWFFTSDNTHKIDEIEKHKRVNVAYSKPDDNVYLSISGRAEVVKDRAKIEELWNPVLKAWFPDGLDDPHLCLLKIPVEQAEYWDAPSSKIVQLFGMVKAIATGQEADYGENKKITL